MIKVSDKVHWLSVDDILFKVTLRCPDSSSILSLRLLCRSASEARDFASEFFDGFSILKIESL